MKNRFLKLLIGSVVSAVATLSVATELKLADFQPSTHPYVSNVYAPMIQLIKTKTSGAVTVRPYMGGELGPGPVEQYNRAVNGVADITFGLPGYTAANFPKTLLTELPGVLNPETGTEKVLANLDSINKEYRRVVLLGLWSNAPNMLLMANKPIRSLSDLKGLKIRTPSRNAGKVLEAWGATPVSMPAPEIYNAMQTGVIDGAFIDGTALQTFKLAEVTKYATQGMKPTISSFFLIMNRGSFEALTPSQQAAVKEGGKVASLAANKVQLTGAEKAITSFAATPGKELINLAPSEVALFNAASEKVTAKVVSEADAAGLEASSFVQRLQK